MDKRKVGLLGATGSVGQKFIELLDNHPWFELCELGASKNSAEKKYKDAVNWISDYPLPENIGEMEVKNCIPDFESDIIFSALDSSVAGTIEEEFAKNGYKVISNARNFRTHPKVPLVVPEINPDHLNLINHQAFGDGFIVTNPNCSTIGVTLALKPLLDNFGLSSVNIVTMQAVSGAGYPGIPALDISRNVIPFIPGEEEKLESEPCKIFGSFENGIIKNLDIKISAQCNRVDVIDGHTECVQVKLENYAEPEEIINSWNSFAPDNRFMNLPSAPENPIVYMDGNFYPQPAKNKNLGKGMTVSVGRLRKCSLFDYKFTVLSHNTVRGAAGGTILIAEMLSELDFKL